jgi:acyl-CoA synthetase (AMP-forming)/AMP-acid ligase II
MGAHFLVDLCDTWSAQPLRPALKYRDQMFTCAQLDARCRDFGAGLQALGVEPGDRVAVATSERLPFLIAHLATLYAGAVSLPLNPRFTREELRYFLSDSGARAAIVGAENRVMVESLRGDLPALRAVVPDTAVLQPAAASFRGSPIPADQPALIVYSSGTTGWPKGVVHTHENLARAHRSLQRCWRVTPDDTVVNVLPLFHVHGLCFATQMTFLAGGCVLLGDRFDPRETLELIGRGTVFMAVPTIYYRFLEQSEFRTAAGKWPDLRLCTCGSAPIRPEVLPELEAILGRPIINRYGMTEAHVITSLPLDGPWPCGSVGIPLDGIEVRIDREDGSPAAPGEVGAVRVRRPNLFREYWGKPEATRAALVDGWFDTGDLGQRDDAGFLTLVGRKNDLIITNGYNVYPQVVERVIASCPGVREAAVFGVPDARRGERVAVAVVRSDPALDESRLRAYWNERLVDYQRPLTITFTEALPRNSMGKVLRRELREKWRE